MRSNVTLFSDLKAQLAASKKEVESLNNSYVELLKELEKQGAQQHPQLPPGQRR